MDQLADRWIGSYRTDTPMSPGQRARAKDEVVDLVADNPVAALALVACVLHKTRDAWVLENLGAGPIEDLLRTLPRETLAQLARHPCRDAVAAAIDSVWTGSLSVPVREELARIRDDLDAV